MKQQLTRPTSWAVVALLSSFIAVACSGESPDPSTNAGGTGGDIGSDGGSGSAGTGSTGGASGSGGNQEASAGSGGAAGTGGCGDAGHGSVNSNGSNCAGTGGSGSVDGSAGMAGSAGSAGSGGTGSTGGSAGQAGSGSTGGSGGDSDAGPDAGGDTGSGGGTAGSDAGTDASDASSTDGSAGADGSSGSGGGSGTGGTSGTGGATGSGGAGSAAGTGGAGSTGGSGGSGGTGSTGGTGGSGSTGGAGGTSGTGGAGGTPNTLSCGTWTRDPKFDAFKIDGTDDVALVGGVWGTSASNIYVPSATYSKAVVAHWNGSSWSQQDLATTINGGTPAFAEQVRSVWGSGPNDVWVAARGNSGTQGMLFHKTSGNWTEDPNEPYARAFEDVWGSDASNVFVMGWKTTGYKVWRKSGSSWVDTGAPTSSTGYGRFYRIWGLDASNVFVTGEESEPADGGGTNPVKGVLNRWNGAGWTSVSVPAQAVSLYAVTGTSVNDLFVTGMDASGDGLIFHVTNNLGTWTPYANGSIVMGPVWSPKTGTVLAGGYADPPGGPGSMRLTCMDQVNPTHTESVDAKAYNPTGFWAVPSSTAVHFVHIGNDNFGLISGYYSSNCN